MQKQEHDDDDDISYSIAGAPLSERWLEIVKSGKVSTNTQINVTQQIQYGVRRRDGHFQEYVQILDENESKSSSTKSYNPILEQMNSTLSSSNPKPFHNDGRFTAQLQLIRTLRPPSSPGFVEATSSKPPTYVVEEDSFVTGTLKLTNRPRTAILKHKLCKTSWDVYHNISPADKRGHFLLLPTLDQSQQNWRSQTLLKQDCHDLILLVSTIFPLGSLWVVFNSVGAGASQNHIHCHAWPSPASTSFVEQTETDTDTDTDTDKNTKKGWESYAVSQTLELLDYFDCFDGKIEITYLKYPCFCILLSSSIQYHEELCETLHTILISIGDSPYNIGMVNRPPFEHQDDEEQLESHKTNSDDVFVDIYVFVRSKERSPLIPTLKLGASEMLGIFHAQSQDEMETLRYESISSAADLGSIHTHDHDHDHDITDDRPMSRILQDISFEPRNEMWKTILTRLKDLEP